MRNKRHAVDRSGDWVFKIFPFFFGFVFIAILTIWGGMAALMYFGYDTVKTDGVRGLVEQLWCGQATDCKLPDQLESK